MWVSDRYWWIWLIAGLAAGAGVIILSVGFLSSNLSIDRELNEPITTDLLLGVALAIMGIVLALVMSVMSIRARERHRLRTAALRGKQDAVPLAAISFSPTGIPNLTAEPLVLRWRATRQMRFGEGPLYAVLFFCQFAVILIPPALLVVVFVTTADKGRFLTFRQPGDILAVGGAAALGIIAPVLAIIMLRYAPTLFGRPYGVVAAEEGIECATEFGRKFLVRWDEIRLFEVSGSGRSELGSRQYRVYGRRHMVSWSTSPAQGNEFAPDGITPGEMALRLQAMINLVVARTGLQPRTFSKALRATPRPENAAADRVVLLGVAVVALLLAVAAVALPLTDAAWLNVIIGVSLGLTGLLLATWTLRRRRGRPLQPETALPGALLAAAPHVPAGTTVTLSFGATRRTRVLLALVGLPLCANLAPVLLVWFGDGLQRILPGGALPSLTSPVAVGVAFVLAIYGAGGLALLRPAVTGNRRAIVASDRGVSTSLGGVGVAIPWESIERIVAVERTGERLRYAVYRPPSRRALAWPARATTWQTFLPTLNAQMVTPDQLAALVVERSGRTLTIESDA